MFPGGTRSFCVLRPGYPGTSPYPDAVANVTQSLCRFAAVPLLWRRLNWSPLCGDLAAAPKDADGYVINTHYLGIVAHLGNVVGFDFLGMGYRGPLPKALAAFPDLAELTFSRNAVTGEAQAAIGHRCKPRMTFPLSFVTLHTLRVGPFPEWLCNITNLRKLSLRYTLMSGPLPHCIGQLQTLTHLDLSRNGRRGEGFTGEGQYRLLSSSIFC